MYFFAILTTSLRFALTSLSFALFTKNKPLATSLPADLISSILLLYLNSKDFNIKYCLAILNSSFAKRFFETIGRSSVGLYPDDVKKLPIKKIPLQEQEVFAQKVDELREIKKDLLNQDTAKLEKELDDMVNKLYA